MYEYFGYYSYHCCTVARVTNAYITAIFNSATQLLWSQMLLISWLPWLQMFLCLPLLPPKQRFPVFNGCHGYANAPQAFHPIIISYLYITLIFAVVCTNNTLFSIIWILIQFRKAEYDLQVPICYTASHSLWFFKGNCPGWCSWDTQFESRAVCTLTLLFVDVICFLSVPAKRCQDSASIRPWHPPSASLQIDYSLIIPSLHTMYHLMPHILSYWQHHKPLNNPGV